MISPGSASRRQSGVRVGAEAAAELLAIRHLTVRRQSAAVRDHRPARAISGPARRDSRSVFTPLDASPRSYSSCAMFRPHRRGTQPTTNTPSANEVRASSGHEHLRTPEQTTIGKFWAGPIQNYWNACRAVVLSHHAISTRGAGIRTARPRLPMPLSPFTSKYTYRLWRPITAIRLAGTDGNPATAADPTWTAAPHGRSSIRCAHDSARAGVVPAVPRRVRAVAGLPSVRRA